MGEAMLAKVARRRQPFFEFGRHARAMDAWRGKLLLARG